MGLDLRDVLPLWERKLTHPLHMPEVDGKGWREADVAVPAHREPIFRDGRVLTQDIVGAIIAGERRTER